jgi:hypothetical protein
VTRTERTAVLGGTFAPSTTGTALLHSAFQTAGHVVVGLTSTALAEQTRSDPSDVELLGPFSKRRAALDDELGRLSGAYAASYEIVELTDNGSTTASGHSRSTPRRSWWQRTASASAVLASATAKSTSTAACRRVPNDVLLGVNGGIGDHSLPAVPRHCCRLTGRSRRDETVNCRGRHRPDT